MPDLWPDDFRGPATPPPKMLLQEQADALRQKTKGVLEGWVSTDYQGSQFLHSFFVVAPYLGNYTYRLFYVIHPIAFYPLELHAEVLGTVISCESPEQFSAKLREVLISDKTTTVIGALLAQVDQGTPKPA